MQRDAVALVSHTASPREQGRVQGAAGALESLGRALGRSGETERCSCSARAAPTARPPALLLLGAAVIVEPISARRTPRSERSSNSHGASVSAAVSEFPARLQPRHQIVQLLMIARMVSG